MPVEAEPETNTAIGVIPAAPWRATAVSVLAGHRLAVTFCDGTSGILDLSGVTPHASKGVFAALADPRMFAQGRVELGVVTWPNGADLDPLWMYEEISVNRGRTTIFRNSGPDSNGTALSETAVRSMHGTGDTVS
jgi:hypothetical protein